MISYIQGKVIGIEREDRYNLIDVLLSSGIGYQIVVPKLTDYGLGSDVKLYTYLVVREDSLTLFGFRSREERDVFEMLISVSGIGPKIGVSILSVFSAAQLYEVILMEDFSVLGKVPGLGKKGAQKIVIDLKSKVEKLGVLVSGISIGSDGVLDELESALKSLGFAGDNLKEYMKNAREFVKDEGANYTVEELIKLVLKTN